MESAARPEEEVSVIRDPYHRIHAAEIAVDHKTPTSDPLVAQLVQVIEGTSTDDTLCYAWEKYRHPTQRNILEALLLADANSEQIADATEIPLAVIEAYSTHIYDRAVFRDRLDRVAYVEAVTKTAPPREARLLQTALTCGADYILWLLLGHRDLSPKQILRTAATDAHCRSQAHRLAPLDSEIAKEARLWADQAARLAMILEKVDPSDSRDAIESLKLALQYEDTTINQDTPGAPKADEILH